MYRENGSKWSKSQNKAVKYTLDSFSEEAAQGAGEIRLDKIEKHKADFVEDLDMGEAPMHVLYGGQDD